LAAHNFNKSCINVVESGLINLHKLFLLHFETTWRMLKSYIILKHSRRRLILEEEEEEEEEEAEQLASISS
jgi:hypothetical protein